MDAFGRKTPAEHLRSETAAAEAKGYKRGLLEAAKMAEERVLLLQDASSKPSDSAAKRRLAISLRGGVVEMEALAARLRSKAGE